MSVKPVGAAQVGERRLALVIAALVLVGTGAWFGSSWIDTGEDSTCGPATQPSVWLDEGVRDRCGSLMSVRAGVSVACVAAGLGILGGAVTRSRRLVDQAGPVVLVAVASSAVLLVVNEVVRSGGAL